MNALLAIVSPDREQFSPAVLTRMAAALRGRSPRCGVPYAGIAAALVQGGQANASADDLEPHADETGGVRLVIDGRIDNGDEIATAARQAGLPFRNRTSAETALRAYQLWGFDCAARLFGDFAFAVWDERRRFLFCARDVLGTRPLFFARLKEGLAVASEIAPLLEHPGVTKEPNESFLAECLNGAIVSRRDTVWRSIERLEPAHVLVWSDGEVRTREYWRPRCHREIHYQRDDEYAAHLRNLLLDATRARTADGRAFGIMLSGGIDSSTVIGAVHALRPNADPVRTYSLASPGQSWDESPFIDAVVRRWPVASRRIAPDDPPASYFVRQAAACRDLPAYPNGVMADPLFAAAAADSVSVLLTGVWGDEWFNAPATETRPSVVRAIWPHVPRTARAQIRRVLGRSGVSPWIHPAFARATALADRVAVNPPLPLGSPSKSAAWARASSGSSVHAGESESRAAAAFGLDIRHPIGDRRILEFGLAIPDDQRRRGNITKLVLRNAAREWLPEPVYQRSTFATAGSVLVRAIERQVAAGLWQNAAIARRGWVSRPALQSAFDEMLRRRREGRGSSDAAALRLWFVCAVEIFLRYVVEGEPV